MTNLRVTSFVLLLIILMIAQPSFSQSRKRLRELEKMEKSHETEEETNNDEAKKRHLSIQSKQTRKEMKRYKRLNKRTNNNKRPLFSRLRFTRKRK